MTPAQRYALYHGVFAAALVAVLIIALHRVSEERSECGRACVVRGADYGDINDGQCQCFTAMPLQEGK